MSKPQNYLEKEIAKLPPELEPMEEDEFFRQIKTAAIAALDTGEPLAHYVAYWGFLLAAQIHGFGDDPIRLWILKKLRGDGQLNSNEALRDFLEGF